MKQPAMGNLFEGIPDASARERTEILVSGAGFRIERIVSRAQSSEPDFWYDQEWDEWVAVLRGSARLELETPRREIELGRGDWIHLPAHCRHRVAWTEPGRDTVWIALHGQP